MSLDPALIGLTEVPVPQDPLYTHRFEDVEYTLLEAVLNTGTGLWEEHVLGTMDGRAGLPGVETCSLHFSIHDIIRSGGSLTVADTDDISWHNKRIKVTYVRDGERTPYGVFIPSSPRGSRGAEGLPRTVELYDKLLILHQDAVDTSYEVVRGGLASVAIQTIFADIGQTLSMEAIENETPLKATLFFEVGTTKLQIVNKLLDSLNFFALFVDGDGQFQARKYVAPMSRGVSPYELVEGRDSVYLEDFDDDEDTFNIPNKVIVVARVDGDRAPFTAMAVNQFEGPFSYAERGRWVAMIETDVDAINLATLKELAVRKLSRASAVTRTYKVTHALLPYSLNDVAVFDNPTNGINRVRVAIQAFDIDFQLPGVLASSTLREVNWDEDKYDVEGEEG